MMESPLTAPAQTERDKKWERVVKAAADWVYDQTCSDALAELEDAVADLIGTPINANDDRPMREAAE